MLLAEMIKALQEIQDDLEPDNTVEVYFLEKDGRGTPIDRLEIGEARNGHPGDSDSVIWLFGVQ